MNLTRPPTDPALHPHAGPHRVIEPPITRDSARRRLLQHPVPPANGSYEWMYLWQFPLRMMHWLAAISVVALVLSGFWIGRPHFMGSAQSTSAFGVQWARLIHFGAGMLLAVTGLVRVYWLVAGNRFERFKALFPVQFRDMRNLIKQTRFYLFMAPRDMPSYIGHNPMAQLSYTMVYLAAVLMVLTGFALYTTTHPNGWMYSVFYPVTSVLGGLQNVRLVHHLLTWFFIIFIPVHVYLAVRSDVLERGGGISQMINGGKFVPLDEEFADAEN